METIEQLEAMGYRLVKAQAQIQHDLQVIEQRINQLREEQKNGTKEATDNRESN